MARIRGVILDLDGLLIDSEMWSWQAHNAALHAYGNAPLTLDEVRRLVGLANEDEWKTLRAMRELPPERQEYQVIARESFIAYRDRSLAPMPGVRELMSIVSTANLRLALASNSPLPSITAALTGIGIRTYFAAVTSGDEVPLGKPAPDVYLKALERIGLQAEEAIAIEDSQVGIRAATSAGLICLAVPNELTIAQDLSAAHQQFTSLHGAGAWLAERLAEGLPI
ncbi:MAG: HAD-superfamily hydrolase, subfamily variant 3 [Chloroflexi bacterium]|jgi:HAD superfamily hydrolase (TIGR01509 family)|nr:HAD-superfamily hydrolase, subfamily variant 3 [Chloroflexota bacterium]MDB5076332.1 HAD-superfamily hydrolase, subfamily variant 3 [Chloroflexota bacterium]